MPSTGKLGQAFICRNIEQIAMPGIFLLPSPGKLGPASSFLFFSHHLTGHSSCVIQNSETSFSWVSSTGNQLLSMELWVLPPAGKPLTGTGSWGCAQTAGHGGAVAVASSPEVTGLTTTLPFWQETCMAVPIAVPSAGKLAVAFGLGDRGVWDLRHPWNFLS